MRALITGGRGKIGRVVADEMKRRGVEIFCPSRSEMDVLAPDARWDEVFSTRWDLLVHCAWMTAHGTFWESPDNLLWQKNSLELFRRFWAGGGDRIVGLGTCAEYEWPAVPRPLGEDSACNPRTLYGRSKLSTFLAARQLAKDFDSSFAWARVFFTFGPGESETKLIPSMVKAQRLKERLHCGPADSRRDFCDFSSIGRAIAGLALCAETGPINVGSGFGLSLREIYDAVLGVCGGDEKVVFADSPSARDDRVIADVSRLARLRLAIPEKDVRAALASYVGALSALPF